jgi:hypothetical protein
MISNHADDGTCYAAGKLGERMRAVQWAAEATRARKPGAAYRVKAAGTARAGQGGELVPQSVECGSFEEARGAIFIAQSPVATDVLAEPARRLRELSAKLCDGAVRVRLGQHRGADEVLSGLA